MWERERDMSLDAEYNYAIRMVRNGAATIAQAASMCGVDARELKARLDALASMPQLQLQPVRFER